MWVLTFFALSLFTPSSLAIVRVQKPEKIKTKLKLNNVSIQVNSHTNMRHFLTSTMNAQPLGGATDRYGP